MTPSNLRCVVAQAWRSTGSRRKFSSSSPGKGDPDRFIEALKARVYKFTDSKDGSECIKKIRVRGAAVLTGYLLGFALIKKPSWDMARRLEKRGVSLTNPPIPDDLLAKAFQINWTTGDSEGETRRRESETLVSQTMPPNLRCVVAQAWRSTGSRRNFSSSPPGKGDPKSFIASFKLSVCPSFKTFRFGAWSLCGFTFYGATESYKVYKLSHERLELYDLQRQKRDRKRKRKISGESHPMNE
ncbi:unnamed protein product [Thlaspi arvense]|uniref:Uncharacterized protein n=1 Tax=Thlaspi arvense TaxID=13288 RepID=A0AAU9S1L3_THLAR|nr:unnamed protein product [Thlaspi arvense]